jgi:GT2 family glycosyltransferase
LTSEELSIVIPTLGRSQALAEVLAGLARQRPRHGAVEVIVVVDARGAIEEAEALAVSATSLDVRVEQARRPGASAARNAGWRAARRPLVLFLDDDIVPTERLVYEHLAWHSRHPHTEVGVLGNVRWSPHVKVTPFMRWLEMGIQFDFGTIRGVNVGWERFYSCNVSVKRDLLEAAGGFDEERFPFGYEDLELARRMHDRGLKLLYNEAALGEHLKTETLETWRRNLPRIAEAERRFTTLYPEERPYFYERFRVATDAPPSAGRWARLARVVPPGTPWLGRLVWFSYDLVCSQRLGPEYLAAWEASEA